jgi:hypothetical protein
VPLVLEQARVRGGGAALDVLGEESVELGQDRAAVRRVDDGELAVAPEPVLVADEALLAGRIDEPRASQGWCQHGLVAPEPEPEPRRPEPRATVQTGNRSTLTRDRYLVTTPSTSRVSERMFAFQPSTCVLSRR